MKINMVYTFFENKYENQVQELYFLYRIKGLKLIFIKTLISKHKVKIKRKRL